MVTKDEIAAEMTTLDSVDIAMWTALIYANTYYRENKAIYPDVATQLSDASGTVKGQMLNAVMTKIEALGVGEIKLDTPDDGLHYSQHQERDALVAYALSIMYDAVLYVLPTDEQLTGYTQVRQRGDSYSCPICGYYHTYIFNGTCAYRWPL